MKMIITIAVIHTCHWRLTHLTVYGGVEHGQRTERYEVHDEQVHPVYVDGYVVAVVAQVGGVYLVHELVVTGVHALLDAHLHEPGDVVEDGERDGGHHVGPGPAVRAQGPGAERVADGHEPF